MHTLILRTLTLRTLILRTLILRTLTDPTLIRLSASITLITPVRGMRACLALVFVAF